SIMAFVLLFAIMATGCMKSQSTTAPAGGNTPAQTYDWKMISTWGEGSLQYENDVYFVDLVKKLSNGRLNIKLHAVGELAPANQVLDMVSKGTVQMGSDWPNYWSGMNTAFDLLGSQGVGFSQWDYLLWMEQAGGRELYNEIYGKFNTVYFPTSISGMESGIRSTSPIRSLEDLKGKKIRMAGLIQSQLAQEVGATPVTLATTEIYEALQRGVVDGAEYSSPAADERLKIHEVTKYWLAPGWHQTSSVYGTSINKDAWASLPDDLKAVVEEASRASVLARSASFAYGDALASERILESGIETTKLSDSDMQKLREIKNGIMSKLASENPDFDRVWKS
ncbi:TRAP transporter substrate-binding protein, partial [Ammoniphilus sp. 3BR4]|uniref:TRAP transporter substrate-binding protein n=1 Tax=Ammoniphilus sp. 3BR4 TaxID=3158265 RepID=UPI003467B0EF